MAIHTHYYPISEDAARRAKEANSYRAYMEGSATSEYRRMVDMAAAIAEMQKQRVGTEYHEKIDALLDKYARKLAENMNKKNEIDARVPSIMIVGGSNFPVRQKEKQNDARKKNAEEFVYIQGLLNKIESVGMGGIRSDDENAIEKLEDKLLSLEQVQQKMKSVNSYYRKHRTLDSCPWLSVGEIAALKAEMSEDWHIDDVPFRSWELQNNNANIRRIRERIANLQREAERAKNAPDPVYGDGYVLVENSEIGRIQFKFNGKPDEKTRTLLKSYGFRWAPSEAAWQRMLNDNGRYAARRVIEEMQKEAE